MLTYKGKKIADRGLVINLAIRPEKKVYTDNLLTSLGFEGYEFIDGVIFEDPYWKQMNFGCTQALLNCMKISLDSDENDLIVFEDDIKVMNGVTTSDFDNVFDKWEYFSKYYDIISMGSRPIAGARIIKEDDNFGRVTNSLCTHAFYYKRAFMEYYYNNLKNYNIPGDPYYRVVCDEFLNDCCSHEIVCRNYNKIFNVGITIPLLFSQLSGFSDGANSEGDFDKFIENCYWLAIKKGQEQVQ